MTHFRNKYLGSLRTESLHIQSGNKLITDAPLDNNGKGEAFSPTDLVCSALCSCMMTIMGIVANREEIDISGMEGDITKVMAANPRRISEVHIHITMPDRELSQKQKEVLKRAALTCPVALSLHPDIKQVITFNF